MELFERDVPVYLLYGDNTEAMAFEQTEILNHDGIFGIDRADWEGGKGAVSRHHGKQMAESLPTESGRQLLHLSAPQRSGTGRASLYEFSLSPGTWA